MEKNHSWCSGKKLVISYSAEKSKKYKVKDIPVDYITDINYSEFKLVKNSSGYYIPASCDDWVDFNKRFTSSKDGVIPVDTHSDNPANAIVYGNIGQFKKLKFNGKKYNLGLTIGGPNNSMYFTEVLKSDEAIDSFLNEVIAIFKRCKIFNRIDIDWDYILDPLVDYEFYFRNYLKLLATMRKKFDYNNFVNYEINISLPPDIKKLMSMPIFNIGQFVDYVTIKSFNNLRDSPLRIATTHIQNLWETLYTEGSIDSVVKFLDDNGIPKSKIIIGVCMKSAVFFNTTGLGQENTFFCNVFSSVSDVSYEYKNLPCKGSKQYYDREAGAGYSYDDSDLILHSYETVKSIDAKCKYIWNNGLKGICVYDPSGDLPINNVNSIVQNAYLRLSCDLDDVIGNRRRTKKTKNTFQKILDKFRNAKYNQKCNKGIWDKNRMYSIDDSVFYRNKAYKCISPNLSDDNNNPGYPSKYWNMINTKTVEASTNTY